MRVAIGDEEEKPVCKSPAESVVGAGLKARVVALRCSFIPKPTIDRPRDEVIKVL